jgi:hypothetical protein
MQVAGQSRTRGPGQTPAAVPGLFRGYEAEHQRPVARSDRRELKLHGTDWARSARPRFRGRLREFRPGSSLVAIPSCAEEIEAIVDEAHRMGLKVACHTYGGEGMRSCVQAGVDLPMHLLELYKDEALMKEIVQKKLPVMMTLDDLIGLDEPDRKLTGGKTSRLMMGELTFKKLLAAGVPSPFGSGAVPERYPHGRQANQFAFFVKWGMTPAQALQTAFLTAANVLNYGVDASAVSEGDSPTSSRLPAIRSKTSRRWNA